MSRIVKIIKVCLVALLVNGYFLPVVSLGASPTAPSFELCVSPMTGTDCTGDGGGAGGYALNEFYVGQTFNANILLSTGGQPSRSANIIVHYDTDYLRVNDYNSSLAGTQISPGYIYESYPSSGNSVDTTAGIIRLTGSNPGGSDTNVTNGVFGTISFTVLQQREDMYGTSNPLVTWIDFTSGATTDSNIVRSVTSADILSSVENSNWYLWPDTSQPYIDSFNYPNGSTGVPVEAVYSFHFRDNNSTSGDETGVNTSTLNVEIQEGSGSSVNRNSWVNYSCSGTWGNNDCRANLDPAVIGDNWKYDTTYTVTLKDGQDRASTTQSPAGPNTMDSVVVTFHTEPDVDPPHVTNNAPTGTNIAANSNITFRIQDTKTSVATIGTLGTGVNVTPMRIDVTSASTGATAYACGDGLTTCTAQVSHGITWAYDVSINPTDFDESEQVFVTVRGATDLVSNTMLNYNWSFWTYDNTGPVIDRLDPGKSGTSIPDTGKLYFHISDTGVGVNITTLAVRINTDARDDTFTYSGTNRFEYSGDSSDYLIAVTPVGGFSANVPVSITINARDMAGNALSPEAAYAVINGQAVAQECPPTDCTQCSCEAGTTEESTDKPPTQEEIQQITEAMALSSELVASQELLDAIQTGGDNELLSQLIESPEELGVVRKVVDEIDAAFTSEIGQLAVVQEVNDKNVQNPLDPVRLVPFPKVKDIKEVDAKWKIQGKTIANAQVKLFIFSDPVVLETTSDDSGVWNVELDKRLSYGNHSLVMQIEKDGKRSNFIYGGSVTIVSLWYWYLVILLVIMIIGLGVWLFVENLLPKIKANKAKLEPKNNSNSKTDDQPSQTSSRPF